MSGELLSYNPGVCYTVGVDDTVTDGTGSSGLCLWFAGGGRRSTS